MRRPGAVRLHAALGASHDGGRLRHIHFFPVTQQKRLTLTRRQGLERFLDQSHRLRLLQRGCSLFFGTRLGRLFTLYLALPLIGAYILIEGVKHMIEAGAGLWNWLSGWNATIGGRQGPDSAPPYRPSSPRARRGRIVGIETASASCGY